MKKIGLITLYNKNFGSILQSYSTIQYVESLGFKCIILEKESFNELSKIQKFLCKLKKMPINFFKVLRYRGYSQEVKNKKMANNKDLNLLSKTTLEQMDKFINDNYNVKKCKMGNLSHLNNEFSAFIVGSDQIWNGSSEIDDFYFLKFANRNKRITLAPSFGVSKIPVYNESNVKKGLQGFDKISVREETGINIIKSLTGRDAVRLPDPTIIFGKDEWHKFAKKGVKKSNYILLLFLNEPNKIAIKIIKEYLNKFAVETICIVNEYDAFGNIGDYIFLDINPYDYVSLIENANYVFTDSFHSTLFSINLCTDFLTFDRKYLHNFNQSSRIVDLLNRYNLIERLVNDEISIDSINMLKSWNSDNLLFEEKKLIRTYIYSEITKRDKRDIDSYEKL